MDERTKWALLTLYQVRKEIEQELEEDGLPGRISDTQAALLDDICRAFGLDGDLTHLVIGPAYWQLILPEDPEVRRAAIIAALYPLGTA